MALFALLLTGISLYHLHHLISLGGCNTLPEDWRGKIHSSVLTVLDSRPTSANANWTSRGDIIADEGPSGMRTAALRTGQLFAYNYWPNNGKCIPFKLHPTFNADAETRQRVLRALRTIERRTQSCITFKVWSNESEYIHVKPGRYCEADVGRTPGTETRVHLGSDCMQQGIILHELLHALGFFHEHNRPDRDHFLEIFPDHVESGKYDPNFIILRNMSSHGIQYDFESIMHYGPLTFAHNINKPTMVPKVPSPVRMGQQEYLSALDAVKLKRAYGCIDEYFEPVPQEAPLTCTVDHYVGGPAPATTISTTTNPDNDECALGKHNCGLAYECVNTQGSFQCTPKQCPKEMRLDYERGQCIRVDCPPGYEANDEGHCVDTNKCAIPGTCKRNQNCFNTAGSFVCRDMLSCGSGYLMNEQGTRCVDVDECADGTHACVGEQRCENHPGSYYCACLEGFEFDNSRRECKDIDECKERSPCHQGCTNTWGGYNCTCKMGYKLADDRHNCDDVDECKEQTTHQLCFGDCINVPGGYNCTCPSGFRMLADIQNCQDIDECKDEQQCSREDQICTNLEGSFHCHTLRCPRGYIQDQDQKNRCRRLSLVCPIGDVDCLHLPISISYNFLVVSSKPVFPLNGRIDLFTVRGPQRPDTNAEFNLELKNTRLLAPSSKSAERRLFDVRTTGFNQATISLIRALDPQEVNLEMQMSMTTNGVFAGKAVSKIMIIVAQTRTSDFIPLH